MIEVLAERAVARRVAAMAEAELPLGLTRAMLPDGVAISGPGLVRRIAFDARLREIGR